MTYVVDTSVFLRWWVDQIGWQHAQRVCDEFLACDVELCTPEFTRVEHAEVLRKVGYLKGLFTEAEHLAAAEALDVVGIELVPLDPTGGSARRSAWVVHVRCHWCVLGTRSRPNASDR